MTDQKNRVPEQPVSANEEKDGTNQKQRRPFSPPTLQKAGELKELTHQFGGSV